MKTRKSTPTSHCMKNVCKHRCVYKMKTPNNSVC